jgi:hypothetical protein
MRLASQIFEFRYHVHGRDVTYVTVVDKLFDLPLDGWDEKVFQRFEPRITFEVVSKVKCVAGWLQILRFEKSYRFGIADRRRNRKYPRRSDPLECSSPRSRGG